MIYLFKRRRNPMVRKPNPQTARLHKTSIAISQDLWRKLKIAAIEDGERVQQIIARLIEGYLQTRESRGRRDA
jgi:hypothetical protein